MERKSATPQGAGFNQPIKPQTQRRLWLRARNLHQHKGVSIYVPKRGTAGVVQLTSALQKCSAGVKRNLQSSFQVVYRKTELVDRKAVKILLASQGSEDQLEFADRSTPDRQTAGRPWIELYAEERTVESLHAVQIKDLNGQTCNRTYVILLA